MEAALIRYQNILSRQCLTVGVPDWLEYVSDNVIAPSLDLRTSDGCKWIKFSNYNEFRRALGQFGNQNVNLKVFVMPYAPLRDSFMLHDLILNGDQLPLSFSEAVVGKPEGGVGVEPMEDFEGEDDIEIELDNVKAGVYSPVPGVEIHFNVVNYGCLWAKAESYCNFTFIGEAFSSVVNQLDVCQKQLFYPTADTLDSVIDYQVRARLMLIYQMHLIGQNPHDAIHSFFPNMHDNVY